MEKEFVPYEQALALKELGFDEPCFGAWVNRELFIPERERPTIQSLSVSQCTGPLYQQAFRWFREKYNLHCNIDPWGYCIFDDNGTEKTGFETYEQSQLECIEELIKIVK